MSALSGGVYHPRFDSNQSPSHEILTARFFFRRVTKTHGNSGVVKGKFKHNLPPHSFGASVRVVCFRLHALDFLAPSSLSHPSRCFTHHRSRLCFIFDWPMNERLMPCTSDSHHALGTPPTSLRTLLLCPYVITKHQRRLPRMIIPLLGVIYALFFTEKYIYDVDGLIPSVDCLLLKPAWGVQIDVNSQAYYNGQCNIWCFAYLRPCSVTSLGRK